MAHRKKQSHDEELPFVALMDTMTNVVGVLIIVLVMIGISLANSVRKVLSELPPVTVEQLQEMLKKVVDATPKEDPKKLVEEQKKIEDQIKKSTEELKTLDLSTDKQKIKTMDLDEIRKKLDDSKKQRDAKKDATDKLFAEVDKLKALLDTTPVYTPPPSTVVRLPNPRPMPEKAVLQRFLVANGKVLYLNEEEFMKLVVTEIEKSQKQLLHAEVPIKAADGTVLMVKDRFGKMVPRTKTVLDPKKLVAHFEKLRIATRDLKLEVVPTPNSPRFPMKLTPAPTAGETADQVKNPASVFQRAMRKFKSEAGTVVWFLVYKDSVEAYLAAREVADEIGVPAGWEIYNSNFFQRPVVEFEVDYIPPKPNPNPPAPTVPGVRIAPPKTSLD